MLENKFFSLWLKEIKDYLYSFRFYIFLTIYLFISGSLISSYIGSNANTNIEGVMPNFVLLFIFFIPLLVAHSFYKDQKSNSQILFLTSSTNSIEIILTKASAIFALTSAVLFINFIQFALVRIIDIVSFRILICTFFGFWLLIGVLISLSILMCCLIKNCYMSFIITYAGMILLFLSTYFEKYIPAYIKSFYSLLCIFFDLNSYWYIGKFGMYSLIHAIATIFITLYLSMRLYRKRCMIQ